MLIVLLGEDTNLIDMVRAACAPTRSSPIIWLSCPQLLSSGL